MLKSFLCGVSLFISLHLSAQYDNFAIRNYSAIHGLPQSQVNSIVEDANGYLWMGTMGGGLARFDGQEFKVYTTLDGLLSNTIVDVKIDAQQNLWIVHPRGISKFDGISITKFQPPGELSNLKMVRRALVFNDTIFVVSAPGVIGKIYHDSVYYWNKEFKANTFIIKTHSLANGDLCLFLSDGSIVQRTTAGDVQVGLVPKEKKVYSTYNHEEKMIALFYSPITNSYDTYSLDASSHSFAPYSTEIKQPVLLYEPEKKTYWFADNMILATLVEGEAKSVEVLKDIEVTQVYADREGNVWIATNGGGLFKYSHQDFSRCSSDNMRGVMAIQKSSDETMWVGTMDKGLWRISKGKFNLFKDKIETQKNNINCVVEAPNGTVWIGSRYGLGKYDDAKGDFIWYTVKDGLSWGPVTNISFDENGNLWAGTGNGVDFFDGKKFQHFTTEQGLLTNWVNSSYYSKKWKALFVGNEFGINTISNGLVKCLPVPGFENTTVLSIQPYRDTLMLFGSGGAGISVYNPKMNTAQLFSTRQGLLSDFVYFVAADEKNRIWIGTEKGINRIVLNDKLEITENLKYDYDNGLEGVETNQNAFYLGNEDKYFGLIDGLYQFNELKDTKKHSFDPHLTSVEIFYGVESTRNYSDSVSGLFKLPVNPVFPSDKNHITFAFNRVDKRYPKSVQFKYRLKNFDKDWSHPSSIKQVTYSNLPPGDYEFQLMVTNSQGSWSPTRLYYPFTVTAPFYKTAAFGAIAFIVVACLILFILFLRVRQRVEKTILLERVREQEQESLRKEIARDFHDEMGNQLTRIINYVSLLRLNGSIKHTGASHQVDLYTKVEDSAKYLYNGTRDFIWSIDPVNDELSKLFLHIRDFGEKLFEEKEIKFRAHNSLRGRIKLPYGFSREANLIFKEAMTNAFKSAQASNATFSLRQTGDNYEFIFHDDGVGFNVPEIENSNGLKNIRERADKIGSVLRINSKPGDGTTISLIFKLTKAKKHGTTI